MNFEFSIHIYKSVDPAALPAIEMVAVEVKTDPCEDCVVTMKAGAVAYFIKDAAAEAGDWSDIRTNLTYPANNPSYLKF